MEQDPIEDARRSAATAPVETFTRGELMKVATEGWIGRVTVGIQAAISASFRTDDVLRPHMVQTRSEVERRFKYCIEGFMIMRKDLHWAIPRILDELPLYLRCRLDGGDWKPNEVRGAWAAKERVPASELEPDGPDLSDPTPLDVEGVEIGEG